MEQAGASPDVARLSDEQETRLSKAARLHRHRARRARRAYLRLRGQQDGCLAFTGFEGRATRRRARRRKRAAGMLKGRRRPVAGQRPGALAEAGRFAAPYLRDEHARPRRDGRDAGDRHHMDQPACGSTRAVQAGAPGRPHGPGHAARWSCATSRTCTRSGASLYFTFLARQETRRRARPMARRQAGGGRRDRGATAGPSPTTTPSGADHAPWLAPRRSGSWGSSVLAGGQGRASTRRGS